MNARLTGIREVPPLFFFVDRGARFEPSAPGAKGMPAIVLSLFVSIGNPLIVMAVIGFIGYQQRAGFTAGPTVARHGVDAIVIGLGRHRRCTDSRPAQR